MRSQNVQGLSESVGFFFVVWNDNGVYDNIIRGDAFRIALLRLDMAAPNIAEVGAR